MEHRSSQLKISGGVPEVAKLYGGRYRIEFRCIGFSKNDWKYSNADGAIFADFGSLMDAEMKVEGLGGSSAIPDDVYPDMRLVENRLEYTPSGQLVVYFAYETLTDTFVEESDEKVDYELNGLRRVTRLVIAKDGTTYGKTVGTSTIAHTAHGYGTETLYLASAVEYARKADEDGFVRIIETWVQAGTLSVSRRDVGEGRYEVQTTFLVTEGATVGPVTDRSIQNFEGLQTITVSTLQDADGNTIVGDGVTPLYSHELEVPFEYPGEVSILTNSADVDVDYAGGTSTITFEDYVFNLNPPVTIPAVQATRYVFYQTEDEITAADWVYDTAVGRWNPDSWASGVVEGLGGTRSPSDFSTFTSVRPLSQVRAFNRYTAVSPTTESGAGVTVDGASTTIRSVEGTYAVSTSTFTITVSGGPGVPDGNKYVLDVNMSLDFIDDNGVANFKKEIIVATIPTRA